MITEILLIGRTNGWLMRESQADETAISARVEESKDAAPVFDRKA